MLRSKPCGASDTSWVTRRLGPQRTVAATRSCGTDEGQLAEPRRRRARGQGSLPALSFCWDWLPGRGGLRSTRSTYYAAPATVRLLGSADALRPQVLTLTASGR